ncbi:MAG: branched-chain amino acid transaminase [Planctomycetes bacterium]|nr:branched-chain amino acid transaminase [Planctomycetota bacterium]
MEKTKWIWLDGKLIPWEDATFHFFTHTLHYGLGAFEGIRAYRQEGGGSAVFRLREHVRRLFDSCHCALIKMPFSADQIVAACVETVRENGLDECYIRPLVWMGEGPMGLGATNCPTRVGIGVFPWGAYLGEEGIKHGIKACISSLNRISFSRHMARAKIVGHYVNSIMANRLAQMAGCAEAILLDGDGLVAEGPGENIFVLREGILRTPPTSAPILAGITRDTVLTLARERSQQLGIEIREESFPRDGLYLADEAFMVGTAAEVTPIREVDGRVVGAGKPGPVTRALASAYQDVLRGRDRKHAGWLTRVE